MKYIILLGDGMADYPLEELGGKTPLQAAHTESMDSHRLKGHAGYGANHSRRIVPGK